MSIEAILESHIAKCAKIQNDSMEFAKRASEVHVKLVERRLKPELQVGEQLIPPETADRADVSR